MSKRRSVAILADPIVQGEVAEWLKAHDSKSCMGQLIEGSNPSLSAMKIDDLMVVYFHDEVGFELSGFA